MHDAHMRWGTTGIGPVDRLDPPKRNLRRRCDRRPARECLPSSLERFEKGKIMNRADRPAYRPPSFPADPTDTPRRNETAFADHGRGEHSWREGAAAVSEGWPIAPDLRFDWQKRAAGEADRRGMRAYHCFFMNRDKMITAVEVIECADDGEARQGALLRQWSPYAVEVWDDARKIFHARAGDAEADSRAVSTG
jgi:hypothetical protein